MVKTQFVVIYYVGIKRLCAEMRGLEIMIHQVDIPILGIWNRTPDERWKSCRCGSQFNQL